MVALASRWEAELVAGELIFVPAGCAHQVVNTAPSIAVAANFVDSGNVARVAADMARKADTAVGVAHEYYALLAQRFGDARRFARVEALLGEEQRTPAPGRAPPPIPVPAPAAVPVVYAQWKK